MSDANFDINVDFSKIISEFDRWANTVNSLNRGFRVLRDTTEAYNSKLDVLMKQSATFSQGGLGVVVQTIERGNEVLSKQTQLLIRSRDEQNAMKTSMTAAYRVNKQWSDSVVVLQKAQAKAVRDHLQDLRELKREYQHVASLTNLRSGMFEGDVPRAGRRRWQSGEKLLAAGDEYAAGMRDRRASIAGESITDSIDRRQAAREWARLRLGPRPWEQGEDVEQILARRRLEKLGNFAQASTLNLKDEYGVWLKASKGGSGLSFNDHLRARFGENNPTGRYTRTIPNAATNLKFVGNEPEGPKGPNRSTSMIDPEEDPFSIGGVRLGHVARIFAIYRAFNMLRAGFEDVREAAHKMNQAIGEIQTISQKSGKAFVDFKNEILAVSSAFGLAAEDVAEGTYQAISNQVVDAAHSFNFMNKAAGFAITTQASLADATNLLSSALNSYGYKAERAEEVSAILFKTIELGRLRAADIADQFGSVAVLGSQLGVSFEELNASLAALTVNGIKSDTAMTFLRGVLQKLVKPTEEMDELLKEWGVSTGQAAVETFGFTGILQKLMVETDGSSKRFGELFNYVRALQGMMSLAGKTSDQYIDSLVKFKEAAVDYAGAQRIMLDTNPAIRFNREVQSLRNVWVSFMMDAEKGAISLTETLGGLNNVFKVVSGLIVAATFRWAMYTSAVTQNTAAVTANQAAQLRLRGTSMIGTTMTAGLTSLAVGAAFVGAMSLYESHLNKIAEANAQIAESFAKLEEGLYAKVRPSVDGVTEALQEQMKALAGERSALVDLITVQEKLSANNFEKLSDAIKAMAGNIRSSVTGLKDFIATMKSAIEQADKEIAKLNNDNKESSANKRMEAETDPSVKANMVEAEIAARRERARALARSGDPANMQEARQLAERNVEEAEKLLTMRQEAGIEATPADKTARQEYIERERARLLKRRSELAASASKYGDPNGVKAGEIEQTDKSLASMNAEWDQLEMARKTRSAKYGGGKNTDVLVKSARDERVAIEEDFKKAAQRQIYDAERKISAEQKALDVFKETLDVLSKMDVKAGDFVAKFEALVTSKGLRQFIELVPTIDAVSAGGKELSELQTRDKNLEARQNEASKVSAAIKDLGNRSVKTATERLERNKQIAQILAEGDDYSAFAMGVPGDPVNDIWSNLGALQEKMRTRVEKAQELSAQGYHDAATRQFNFSDDELQVLAPFMNPAYKNLLTSGTGSPYVPSIDEVNKIVRAGNLAGLKAPGAKNEQVDTGFYHMNSLEFLQKLKAKAEGKSVEFGSQDAEMIKSVYKDGAKPPAVIGTVEALNKLDFAAPETSKAIDALIERLKALKAAAEDAGIDITSKGTKKDAASDSTLIERLKAAAGEAGIDITSKGTKKDAASDSTLIGDTKYGDSRATGGYSGLGGRHHPGEYIINAKQTAKYRSLLEQINYGGDETYMLGQAGGRSGGKNPYDLLSQWVFGYWNGRPLIVGVDNTWAAFGDSFDPLGTGMPKDYQNALTGITGILQQQALRFGGDPTNLINSMWRRGSRDATYMNYRFGGNGGPNMNFGNFNFNFNGNNSSRESAKTIADVVMAEVRRQLARGMRTL